MYLKEEIDMFKLFLVLGIIVFLIVLPFVVKDKRIFFLWIGGLAVWIIGLTVLNRIACGPNSHDVKIMKPEAKAIADYVVKNGVPKSLKDIPDLPYGLVECEHIQHNLERCIFYRNNAKYRTEIYILGDMSIEIYADKTDTGLRYDLNKYSNNQWEISKSNISYSGKSSGFCAPFGRQ